MSADNGIYILVTEAEEGKEYRVRELQAIENVEWDPKAQKPTDDPDVKIENARRMWEGCDVYRSKEEALEYAAAIHQEIMESTFPVLEYGICFITDIPRKF